jgi:hypothetical protein
MVQEVKKSKIKAFLLCVPVVEEQSRRGEDGGSK